VLSWLIFKNYLLSRRSGALVRIIAWHCIIGIAMGVAALIIVLAVMNGFNVTIRSRMLSVEPHLVLKQKERPTADQAEKLKTVIESLESDSVSEIDRFESQDLILRSVEGLFGGAIAKGYDPATVDALVMRIWNSTRNEGAAPVPEKLAEKEVILGTDLARSLGIFEGDQVVLVPPETLLLPKGEIPKLQKFKVKALVSTQTPELDSKLLFYDLDSFPSKMRSLSADQGFEIRLTNPYRAEALKAALAKKGIEVQTWGERDTSLFFALKMESWAMTLFLSLAVLITSFSIVIVMVLLMSQKRQDIGLLMAMGLSLNKVRYTFLQVGLMLSFLGIFSGVLLGTTVSVVLDVFPIELLPDIYTDSTLPAKLTGNILFFVLSSSSLIAVIGSSLPVWRYILNSPAQSLRRNPTV
jgi:lipoprotein-releasing system permease protein